MNKIYSVCWNITEKCNENCTFCYRTLSEDLSLEDNKKIADKLIEHGVEKITFAGGEPLLYEGLFELARYIREKKPSILLSLTTNGLLINDEMSEMIISLFDWITFDIESPSEEYHIKVGRGKEHLRKAIKNLSRFNGKINLKVNTVATKQNLNHIPLIWEILKHYDIKRWKIFRYYPITYKAVDNQEEFNISDQEYLNLTEIIKKMPITDTQVDFNDFEEFKTTYFSIFPNGDLKDNAGKVTCNILESSIDECIKNIDLTNHLVRKRAFERFYR